jgi:basic membrane lipoprotein Med (substrate-binding protein (PBP1-ABC) superfamily)
MSGTLKEFRFTDEQIDQLLRLARNKAFQVKYNPQPEDEDEDYEDYYDLANQIEDQIVNHPTNS